MGFRCLHGFAPGLHQGEVGSVERSEKFLGFFNCESADWFCKLIWSVEDNNIKETFEQEKAKRKESSVAPLKLALESLDAKLV